jgi:hypothetical protein
MREARYASAPPPSRPVHPTTPKLLVEPAEVIRPTGAPPTGAVSANSADSARLCLHRSIGGKYCQRPAGHDEANHRYK